MPVAGPTTDAAVIEVLQTAAAAVGNGLSTDLRGYRRCTLAITGTFVATATFEASYNEGSSWVAVKLMDADGAYQATATAPGLLSVPLHLALPLLRARISAYTSGAVTVTACKQIN
jgi:hypothetical protein